MITEDLTVMIQVVSSILDLQKQQMIEKGEGLRKELKQDCNECISCESGMSNCDIRDQDRKYNQAITDYQNLIRTSVEE